MKTRFCASLVGLALGALAFPVAAQDVDASTVVATVGGEDITVGHMIVARQTLPAQYQQLPDDVLFEGILDQLIQQTALAQSLDAPTLATQLTIANQANGLLAGEALGKATADAVSDDALQEAYDARYANAEPEQEFNASHILVETEEEAQTLVEDLEGGADFAELAMAKSTGPTGPNGGLLGWFSTGMMVPEFEAAVLDLEPGQISGPVQTQFGWHVVKLNEQRIKNAPPLEEVRNELAQEIERAAVEAKITEVVDAAEVSRSEVELDPAILQDLGLVAN